MQILNSLAPVFLLVGLGALLVRVGFINREMLKGMNDLAYWVGLPSFIFYRIAAVSLDAEDLWPMLTVFFASTGAVLVVAWVAARLLSLPAASRGTFLQASFRGNLAFIGLPVVIFAVSGIPDADGGRIEQVAVLALAPIMVAYNVVAVFVLYASHASPGGRLMVKTCRQLITNPLIIASVAGGVVAASGLILPIAIARSLDALSRLALPLALLSIGGSLVVVPVKGRLGPALASSLLKVAAAPLAGIAAARLLGAVPEVTIVAVIFLACPTAAASYVLARQLNGDEALAAASVVVSTILSLVSLGAAVAYVAR